MIAIYVAHDQYCYINIINYNRCGHISTIESMHICTNIVLDMKEGVLVSMTMEAHIGIKKDPT